MSDAHERPRRGWFRGLLWWLALIAGVAVGLPWAFWWGDQYGYERGRTEGFQHGVVEGVAARTLLPRAGVSVALRLPVDEALDGLIQLEDPSPSAAFEEVIDRLYGELIAEIAEVYPFETGHAARALRTYGDMRQRIIDAHYQPLRTWHQERHPVSGMARWSLEDHAVAVDVRSVLQDESCEFVRQAWIASAADPERPPRMAGLCAVIRKELVGPWADALEQEAIDRDVARSVTATRARTRQAIMELATAQIEVEGRVRHDYESKIFEGWPIESSDRASLEVRGTGVVKSGFKLHERYAITVDPDAQRVVVTLPRAEVLSNTMVPEFAMEKEGWWTSLSSAQRNQALRVLEANVRQQALDEGLLSDAEMRAEELVQNLYAPLTTMPGSAYEVQVQFEGAAPPDEGG